MLGQRPGQRCFRTSIHTGSLSVYAAPARAIARRVPLMLYW